MQVKIQLARQVKVPKKWSGDDMRLINDGTN
jgi:hypothetical protein